jgi:hypothetical protein
MGGRIRDLVRFGLALAAIMIAAEAKSQDAEPRLYSNTPVGLNFLIGGYLYSQGKLAFDPALAIVDTKFESHTGAVAYVRSFELFGQSAKFDVVAPYSTFSAHGIVADDAHERAMNGFGDPRFRVSMNLFGAPALPLKDFANYKQDLLVGVSLQVSAPLGQYDDTKFLNLGANRWSFRQAPLYMVRGAIIRNLDSGAWFSLDGLYLKGARTTLNGDPGDNEQENVRAGFTVAVPIDRQNSIKFNASTGVYTRTGTGFSLVGLAWQYRWGQGY